MNIAIVITNYNYKQYLRQAVESAVNQSVKASEILIVDDKSTDGAEKYLPELARDFGVSYVIHDVNMGLPSSRNTGIRGTKSELIQFLDADDILYKDKLKMSLEVFEKYPPVSIVYTDYDEIDLSTGKSRREFKHPYDVNLLDQACIISTNSCFRRSFFDENGLYNPKYKVAEDYELYLRAKYRMMAYHIAKPGFAYRLHGKNITLTQQDQMMRNMSEYKQNLVGTK